MELLLDAALDDSVSVSSAGTFGMRVPTPISPPMDELLYARGVAADDIRAHRSEPLTARHIAEADLILTATADHRAQVLELDPTALRRTMTLGEFGRLLQVAKAQGGGAAPSLDSAPPPTAPRRMTEGASRGESSDTANANVGAIGTASAPDEERIRALLPVGLAARHLARVPAGADDIVDPYRLPDSVYSESLRQIEAQIGAVCDALHD
jgi:protein-tyrosine phosphatase